MMIDYCGMCGEPEHEHTEEELIDCWTVLGMEARLPDRATGDDVPPSEL